MRSQCRCGRVQFHRVAHGPHQHQAPPAVARVDGRCLPGTGIGDPRLGSRHRTASTSVSIDPTLCPRYACSTQFVHASLIDQHDVGGLRSRDVSGLQPRRQPTPDIGQLICGSGAFDPKRRTLVPVDHHRDIVVVSRGRSQIAKHVSATASRGKIHRLHQNFCGTGDSVVDRLVLTLDQAVCVQHQRRARAAAAGRPAGEVRLGGRRVALTGHR